MKQGTQIDLSRMISRITSFYEVDAEYIVSQITRFFNEDTTLITGIRQIILSRLKYSTGNLYRSMKIRAHYDFAEGDKKKYNAETARTQKDVTAVINLDFEMPDKLLNALLGKDEVKTPVPDLTTLTKWVRGKQRYFADEINATNKRRLILKALQMQRNTLKGDDPFISGLGDSKLDAVVIASRMKDAMERRFAKRGTATLGSEYVLVGQRYEEGKKNGVGRYNPVYRVESVPILTIKKNQAKGELNKYLDTMIKKYAELVVSKIKVNEFFDESGKLTPGSVLESMKKIPKEMITTSSVIQELVSGMDAINSMVLGFTRLGNASDSEVQKLESQIRNASVRAANLMRGNTKSMEKDIKQQSIKLAQELHRQALAISKRIG